jgi:hypothetical protein
MSVTQGNFLKVLPQDLQAVEAQLLNDYVDYLTQTSRAEDVKLEPLVATDIKTKEVFFSPKFQAFFKEHKMSEEELKTFFLTRHATHIAQFSDVSSSSTVGYDDSIMLTVISSAYLERKDPPHEIPGEVYHRDGRGNALSVKISLTTQRVWESGQLNIVKPKEGEDAEVVIKGKKHSEVEPTLAPRLQERGEAFLLNNKDVYHAVVSPYIPEDSQIESGRKGFNREFLKSYM